MKEIYLYEAKINEGDSSLFLGAKLFGREQLLGTYQEQEDSILVTKKDNVINLRRL